MNAQTKVTAVVLDKPDGGPAFDFSYSFMALLFNAFAGNAVLPIALVLLWSGCTGLGFCVGTLTGGGN